ncbi:hypothetical protein GCM10008997_09690 [Halomonas salifodinae]
MIMTILPPSHLTQGIPFASGRGAGLGLVGAFIGPLVPRAVGSPSTRLMVMGLEATGRRIWTKT